MELSNNKRFNTIVAIDPDIDRNGVASLNISTRELQIQALSFPETLDYIRTFASLHNDVQVVIEAGWLNKANWHINYRDSQEKAAQIGNLVGRNHEVGRKLAEMCEYWDVPYRLIRPLRKIWKGKDGKITATELAAFTDYRKRTNQEGRDAALIAWNIAGFPIVMKN